MQLHVFLGLFTESIAAGLHCRGNSCIHQKIYKWGLPILEIDGYLNIL